MKRFLTFTLLMSLIATSAFAFNREADTVAEVCARQINDDKVEVAWSWDESTDCDTCEYNVYKKNVIKGKDVELFAEKVTGTVIVDTTWAEAPFGVYQWGVEVVSETNDNNVNIINVDFEDGMMPEGWVTTSQQIYQTTSEWSVSERLAYTNFPAKGKYAAFSNGTAYDGLRYEMITSAVDLTTSISAALSFDYANVEFLGDKCVLNVKVGTSQEGPWETVFSTADSYANEWTYKTIDLTQFIGQTIYVAFENEDYNGYGIGVDNIVLSSIEPKIVWSNTLDKDMYTTVEVTVTSNATESMSGTTVKFVNLYETGFDYEAVLDATATYEWTEFRKGTYEYTVYKKGYESCATAEVVDITDETALECVLTEIINAAKDLYVSPTGFAKWENADADTRAIESYTVLLNGVEEATVTTSYYQHEDVTPGEKYTTSVIANYNTGDAEATEYTWTCVACDEFEGVSNLESTCSDGNAILTWELPEGNYMTDFLNYDDSLNFNYIGQTDGSSFYWGVMFPALDMMPGDLTKVMMFDGVAHSGEFFIYLGGDTIPEVLVTKQEYECNGTGEYVDFNLLKPVVINGTENLWIVFTNTDGSTQVAPFSDVESKNGDWISIDGEQWFKASDVFGLPMTWQVRGLIERGADPLGVVLYRDGELVVNDIISEEIYSDPMTELGTYEYDIRVVYTNYAISCPQNLTIEYVGLAENDSNVLSIYPNPVKDKLTIAAEKMTRITIVNAFGQVMYNAEIVDNEQIIDLTQYEAGIYLVHIATETGFVTEKITVIR